MNENTNDTWDIHLESCKLLKIPLDTIKNFSSLLNDNYTLSFISRYRQEKVNHLDFFKLQELKQSLCYFRKVQERANQVIKIVTKKNRDFLPEWKSAVLSAKTIAEIELLYEPYKIKKETLSEQAKKNGLEHLARSILENPNLTYLESLYSDFTTNLSKKDIYSGVKHILADIISKHASVLQFIRDKFHDNGIKLISKFVLDHKRNIVKNTFNTLNNSHIRHLHKFDLYKNFSVSITQIQSYQVLAINRGERLKVLKVSFHLPESLTNEFDLYCSKIWISSNSNYETANFLRKCFMYAYSRLVKPYLCRQIRAYLTTKAHIEACDMFCKNLKSLLLAQPVRNKVIMGIDPGFHCGCKLAVIDPFGAVLHTETIFIQGVINDIKLSILKLKEIVLKFKCEVLALGTGNGCRETEKFLLDCIHSDVFKPLEPMYTLVSEEGSSAYSNSSLAQYELPDLSPLYRSAVNIARRLQDPLSELIKIEPHCLGIGMYQHDIPLKQLKNCLEEIVVECVSSIGVNLNTASEHLLQKVSGLNKLKARNIINFRNKNGPFSNRSQLLMVDGIGQKSFQQCAGFIRIFSSFLNKNSIAVTKKKNYKITSEINPLDQTCIHPEFYDLAEKILQVMGKNIWQIGSDSVMKAAKLILNENKMDNLFHTVGGSYSDVLFIVNALCQPLAYDPRSINNRPHFYNNILTLTQIRTGMRLSGIIKNITCFGAFIDIGIGFNGLIPKSKIKFELSIGQVVEVSVNYIDQMKQYVYLSCL